MNRSTKLTNKSCRSHFQLLAQSSLKLILNNRYSCIQFFRLIKFSEAFILQRVVRTACKVYRIRSDCYVESICCIKPIFCHYFLLKKCFIQPKSWFEIFVKNNFMQLILSWFISARYSHVICQVMTDLGLQTYIKLRLPNIKTKRNCAIIQKPGVLHCDVLIFDHNFFTSQISAQKKFQMSFEISNPCSISATKIIYCLWIPQHQTKTCGG